MTQSIFKRQVKKTWVKRMQDYDKTHKVPNWLSAIIIISVIILTIKIVTWMATR